MEVLDIFKGDAFTLASLTKAINAVDYVPGRIGQLRWFREEGIPSTFVIVEEDSETIRLVESQPRGGVPGVSSTEKRKARSFSVPHIPTMDKVLADEVQNVRAYATGQSPSDQLLMVQQLVERKLTKMRRRIEGTIEFHRIGALAGKILDADGTTTILDLFDAFEVEQQTHNFAFSTDATDVRGVVRAAQRKGQSALGADSTVTSGGGSGVSVAKIEPPIPLEPQALRKVRMRIIFNQRRNFILCLSRH